MTEHLQQKILSLPTKVGKQENVRKRNINRNKEGSVRKTNGLVYVDFMYLGERVRESSGLPWNEKNARLVREQLDRIMVNIKAGSFRFNETFPASKRRDYFQKREMLLHGFKKKPDDVRIKEAALQWYSLRRESQRITGRTLLGYKSYLDGYLVPFFADMTFGQLELNHF